MCGKGLPEHCRNILNKIEKTWIKRTRKLNTVTVFNFLLESLSTNIGISSIIADSNYCNHTAVYKFRQKLPDDLFGNLNNQFTFCERFKTSHLCN